MNPNVIQTPASPAPNDKRSRQRLFVGLVLFLVLFLVACEIKSCSVEKDESPLQVSLPEPPKRHTLDIKNPSGNTFQVTCASPGPPHPDYVKLRWVSPPNVGSVQTSHEQNRTYSGRSDFFNAAVVEWKLPVDPTTGKTEMVTVHYEPPPWGVNGVDTFGVESDLYPNSVHESIFHAMDIEAAAPPPPVWTRPASRAAAPAAGYYRWLVYEHYRTTEPMTVTSDLCQDWVDLLQSEQTFVGLRFPVLPPTLSYTEPYTLPLVIGPAGSSLALLDERVSPATTVLTVPLEYRPEHHTFLENELPAAPGEHWLAMGVVTTPTIDCANVPTLGKWTIDANLWLDFGGAADACKGCVLPLYYCYAGQEPPAPLAALGAVAGVTSYQGWGITCLGPDALYLESGATTPPFTLGWTHTALITPTETISLSHYLYNSGAVPVTVTLAYSSTPGLPWGVYSGTQEAPDLPLAPIIGPIRLEDTWPESVRYFWMIATVPDGTPSGAGTLVITATDVTSPAITASTRDLLWVGDWVAPPGPPLWYRLYLPLMSRQ